MSESDRLYFDITKSTGSNILNCPGLPKQFVADSLGRMCALDNNVPEETLQEAWMKLTAKSDKKKKTDERKDEKADDKKNDSRAGENTETSMSE